MMAEGEDFIRNHNLLKEDYRQDSGLAKFVHVDLAKRISELRETCVLALVGPYGSGKSTALYKSKGHFTDTMWLQFDAWRYPERRALWDGLIIEIAKQMGQLKKFERSIDGNQAAIGKWGGVTTSIFATVGDLIPKGAVEWLGEKFDTDEINFGKETSDAIKGAGPVADKLVKNLFGRSAAKRAYEFEKILTDLLLLIDESMVVLVVEDVDRSGTDGLHFLETLNYFLHNSPELSRKRIIAVAPVGEESYRQHEGAYLKCVDYIELFRPHSINLDNFIKEVFVNLSSESQPLLGYQTKYFLEGLFNMFPAEMSMRKLKLILREASSAFRLMRLDGYAPEWLIVICIQSMKHFRDTSAGGNLLTYYDIATRNMSIAGGNFFANTLSAITDERRQDQEPKHRTVILPDMHISKGKPFSINNSLIDDTKPKAILNKAGNYDFHLPGYYFQY